jgi:hypothetical protein
MTTGKPENKVNSNFDSKLKKIMSSKYLLNDVIVGRNDPMYSTDFSLQLIISTPAINWQGWATEETSIPNKTCRDVKTTKGLQEQTQLIQ